MCILPTCKRQELHAPGKQPGRRMHAYTTCSMTRMSGVGLFQRPSVGSGPPAGRRFVTLFSHVVPAPF